MKRFFVVVLLVLAAIAAPLAAQELLTAHPDKIDLTVKIDQPPAAGETSLRSFDRKLTGEEVATLTRRRAVRTTGDIKIPPAPYFNFYERGISPLGLFVEVDGGGQVLPADNLVRMYSNDLALGNIQPMAVFPAKEIPLTGFLMGTNMYATAAILFDKVGVYTLEARTYPLAGVPAYYSSEYVLEVVPRVFVGFFCAENDGVTVGLLYAHYDQPSFANPQITIDGTLLTDTVISQAIGALTAITVKINFATYDDLARRQAASPEPLAFIIKGDGAPGVEGRIYLPQRKDLGPCGGGIVVGAKG